MFIHLLYKKYWLSWMKSDEPFAKSVYAVNVQPTNEKCVHDSCQLIYRKPNPNKPRTNIADFVLPRRSNPHLLRLIQPITRHATKVFKYTKPLKQLDFEVDCQ